MEGAMAKNLCSSSAPRAELDYRAREARLRLVRIQQVLAPRARGKGFRLVRRFAWRFSRAPRLARTRAPVGAPRPSAMPEIDSAWFPDAARFRAASRRGPPGNHARFGLNIHAPPNTNSASAPGRIATHRLTAAIAPAPAQMIDESASAKVATREET